MPNRESVALAERVREQIATGWDTVKDGSRPAIISLIEKAMQENPQAFGDMLEALTAVATLIEMERAGHDQRLALAMFDRVIAHLKSLTYLVRD
jgi:hypothetical protein